LKPNLLGRITLRLERVEVTGIAEFGFGTDSPAFSTSPGACPGGFTVGIHGRIFKPVMFI